jgi:cytolysin (calcineurin-like family phosphatase)
MDPVSADYNAQLVQWLNKLPGTDFPAEAGGGTVAVPAGVIHGGDLVDNGDKGPAKAKMVETELAAFLADYGLNGGDGKLRWTVREVHGNHDSPRGEGAVIPEIKARNQRRKGLTGISENGLHYSWDWGHVHFVALGITAGDAPEVTRRRRYAPLGSLPFLKQDLAEHVGTSGRPVVLVHHVDVHRYSSEVPEEIVLKNEWDFGDVHAFYETIKPYRIAATMCGHTHVRKIARWNGTKDDKTPTGVPFLNTDNAAHFSGPKQAFLHVDLDDREMRVREFGTSDGWNTGAWTPEVWRFPLT